MSLEQNKQAVVGLFTRAFNDKRRADAVARAGRFGARLVKPIGRGAAARLPAAGWLR